jgi:Flp pilus assembly pilin Flp
MKQLRAFLANESGQDLAEYAIALAVIALGAAAVAVIVHEDVLKLWEAGRDGVKEALP